MKIEIGSNEEGQRLDKFLRKWLKDVPLSAIYKAMRKGDIRVNGKKKKEKYFLEKGDIVEVNYIFSNNKKSEFISIDSGSLKIIYEDKNMILVEKWPGVLVHSDNKGKENTLTDYVLSYLYDKGEYKPEDSPTFSPSPCNRLDRNTSGIVVYGKNYNSLKTLNEMIRNRDLDKYYIAIVKGTLKDGEYTAYIHKDKEKNISSICEFSKKDTKRISMKIKNLKTCGLYSLIEINLITGRSHQLRAHLAYMGNPIIGDPKYGDSKVNSHFYNKYGLVYQYLYAYKLHFKNSTKDFSYINGKTITASLPPIFKKIKNDLFEKF
jgi:23S rRNA pseudouridine955/2504/2580 synthase